MKKGLKCFFYFVVAGICMFCAHYITELVPSLVLGGLILIFVIIAAFYMLML